MLAGYVTKVAPCCGVKLCLYVVVGSVECEILGDKRADVVYDAW